MSANGSEPLLPAGWEWKPLSDLATVIRGVSYKKDQVGEPDREGFVPLLRATNITPTGLALHDFVWVPRTVVKQEQYVQRGDLVVAASSGSLSVVGKAAPVEMNMEATFGAFCAVVRPLGGVEPSYLRWFMESDFYRSRVSSLAAGSNINNLKREHLLTMPVPLPPLGEQRATVARLESLFSELQAGQESLRRVLTNLRALRSSILETAVATGRERSIGELLHRIEAGKSFRCHGHPAPAEGWGVIKVSAMTWGEFQPYENKEVLADSQVDKRWEIRPGDLLISRANTSDYVGAAVLVEETRPRLLLSDKSLRLVVNDEAAEPRWLSYAINAPSTRARLSLLATGTSDSMRNLGQDKIKSVTVRVPEREEQAMVADEIDRALARSQALGSHVKEQAQRAAGLRRVILRDALSGALSVETKSHT